MIVIMVSLNMLFSTTAYANSSWHWLTKTRPLDVLPFVVVLTILIEYTAIKNANSINRPFLLFIIVCFANMTPMTKMDITVIIIAIGIAQSINRIKDG